MDFRLLGPVEAWSPGGPVDLGSRKQRFVLAVLLLEVNQLVPVTRLVELTWGDAPPPSARTVIQTHIYRLRTALAEAGAEAHGVRLATSGAGYLLAADPVLVDVHRFRALVERARVSDDDARSAALLTDALRLWRGPALAGAVAAEMRERLCLGLEEARLVAAEDRIDALLRLGQHRALVDELTGLVQSHPSRERLLGQLMLALYRSGRARDALDVYRRNLRRLAGDLGLDPGPHLRDLETAILRNDAALLGPAPAPGGPPAHVEPPDRPVPAQLPAEAAGFTGRLDELHRLDALLPRQEPAGASVVITAIAGTAGVGKTALAVRWANRVRDRFPGGQLYVNLRGYDPGPPLRPIRALTGFLHAFDIPPEKIPTDEDGAAALYRSVLAERRTLVLLDNARDPAQVRPLLPGTPGSMVLITSRDRLTGLIAHDGAHRLTLDVLNPDEARTLLATVLGEDRAKAEPDAVKDLAAACAHLPLALRIAAANLTNQRARSVASYVAELCDGDRLAVLDADGDRQAAVRVAFDLSYTTLAAEAKALFRLVGLTPGPDVTPDAAAALAGTTLPEARRRLDRLAAAHLIAEYADGRYTFHDLLRRYATERAEAEDREPDRAAAVQRLLDWYLLTVDAAARLLYPDVLRLPLPALPPRRVDFAAHTDALAWLDAERPNLVAAVRQAARHGPRESAWLLADALRYYFVTSTHAADWLAVARAGLAASVAEGDARAQAMAELNVGARLRFQGRTEPAIGHYSRALTLARRADWPACQVAALGNLGMVYGRGGRPREAIDHYTQALALGDRAGGSGQANNLGNLGSMYWDLGRLADAFEYYSRALMLYRQLGSRRGIAQSLGNLGEVHAGRGEYDEALAHLGQALAIQREIGDRVGEADALRIVAWLHRDAGRTDAALATARAALDVARATGKPRSTANALNTLGTIRYQLGCDDTARGAHSEALAVARQAGERYAEDESRLGLAAVEHRLGHIEQTIERAEQVRVAAAGSGYRMLHAEALTRLAAVQLSLGRPDRAVELATLAVAIARETGHRRGESDASAVLGTARSRLNVDGVTSPSGPREGKLTVPPTGGGSQ